MGDLIVKEQLLGLAFLIVGIGVLTWCASIDRKDFLKRRDPKEKWSYIDGEKEDELTKNKTRGIIMMLIGASMSLFGLISFLLNMKLGE
ncbi:MAG: hypothetical protein ACQ9MH_03545 [Nitrospinales bacterium]